MTLLLYNKIVWIVKQNHKNVCDRDFFFHVLKLFILFIFTNLI